MDARTVALTLLVPLLLSACDHPSQPNEPLSAHAMEPSASQSEAAAHLVGPPGSLTFYSRRTGAARIFTADPDGVAPQQVTFGPGTDIWPDLSPNGRYVAFASNPNGKNDIYVLDLQSGALTNVTNNPADDNWPRWSPDGQRLAFHSDRDGNYNIYTVNADGSDLRRVTNSPLLDQFPDWSPNGKQLAFRRDMAIYVADADGEEQNVRQLTSTPPTILNQMAAWSPDGKQIAFLSLRDGYPSVFLMSADGETAAPAVNLTPKNPSDPSSAWVSRAPSWSRNGQQIYFMSMRPATNEDVEVFAINTDGSGLRRVTTSAGEDGGPRMR